MARIKGDGTKETNFERYQSTWSYKSLLEKHSLDEYGVWNIHGEDSNCDFGGYHHEPFLERVEGRLEDVIFHAVDLPRFWEWGGGGSIRKETVKVKKIGPMDEQIARKKKIMALKEQIAKLEKELENS